MRVEAKPKKHPPKSFWETCGELWNFISSDQQPDAITEQLQLQARKLEVRESVAHQMQSMAKLFGISAQMLIRPDERALRLMRRCDGCQLSGHCFVNQHGKPDAAAHISPQSCPNFGEYQDMARDIGSRTAIKNKLV